MARENKPSDFIKYKNQNEPKWAVDEVNKISGIYADNSSFKEYIKELIPGSFGIRFEFKLASPYFSKDDDELYAVHNPVLKDYVHKIPMIRGSSWKGVLFATALDFIRQKINDIETGEVSLNEILNYYTSIIRIFGTGSKSFRNLEKTLNDFISRSKNDEELLQQLARYALLDLGIRLQICTKSDESFANQILTQIKAHVEKSDNNNGFCTRKGRTTFYPTYFNAIDFEVINFHNKKRRAGERPIFFEVVPRDTKGVFQLVYIPFDAIFMNEKEMWKQQEKDFNFLKHIIEKTFLEKNIGAKKKIGWGRIETWEKIECLN